MKAWSERTKRIGAAAILLAIVQAVLVVAFLVVDERRSSATTPFESQRLASAPAPVPRLGLVDGRSVSWESLRGKPVLLHFWATWCTPCRDELPALVELARTHPGRFHLLAVSLDSDWAPVRLFFGGAIPEHVSRPLGEETQRSYGVATLPDTFVVSASGALVERVHGARDWRSAQVLDRLRTWEAAP